jgi:hypothetical protein
MRLEDVVVPPMASTIRDIPTCIRPGSRRGSTGSVATVDVTRSWA